MMLSVTVGVLFACATFLMLRRHLVRVFIGISLLANSVNLLVFAAGPQRGQEPPLLPSEAMSSPLSQALILTAIVISFALLSFALSLGLSLYRRNRSLDADAMQATADADESSPLAVLEARDP